MKYALITGASRGIGKAIALRLAKSGYSIIINFLSNQDCAQQVLDEITEAGGHAELLPFDAADPKQIEQAIDLWEGIQFLQNGDIFPRHLAVPNQKNCCGKACQTAADNARPLHNHPS